MRLPLGKGMRGGKGDERVRGEDEDEDEREREEIDIVWADFSGLTHTHIHI